MNPALLYAPDAFETRIDAPMGRQHAGSGFLRAAVAGRTGPVTGMGAHAGSGASFLAAVKQIDPAADVAWLEHHHLSSLTRHEVLHLPAPGLSTHAARRNRFGGAGWSITAVTHTIASDLVMGEIAKLPASHVMPWDALICTSRSVLRAVDLILDTQEDMLRRRLGATRFPRPLRPVIPLGIHVDDFVVGEPQRAAARQALGIEADEVVACFLGRLSFHAKAHPAAMYEGLEAAARRTGQRIVVLETGWFANASIEEAFAQGRRQFCPSVRSITTDGRPAEGRATALAASDLFVSLSDNIQETFGLTPLEAMAAGLPVVVSDWDGYRETVRDGLDGFRIPTLMPPGGAGARLAARYESGALTYDQYCCVACMGVSVHPGILAERLAALVADPALRRRLGANGRAHVRAQYDWSVVYQRYIALWQHCAEVRRQAAATASHAEEPAAAALDPFLLFATYPTATLSPETRLALLPAAAAWEARLASPLFAFAGRLMPESVEAARVLMENAGNRRNDTLGEMALAHGVPLDAVMLGASLLAKLGVALPERQLPAAGPAEAP